MQIFKVVGRVGGVGGGVRAWGWIGVGGLGFELGLGLGLGSWLGLGYSWQKNGNKILLTIRTTPPHKNSKTRRPANKYWFFVIGLN